MSKKFSFCDECIYKDNFDKCRNPYKEEIKKGKCLYCMWRKIKNDKNSR